MINERPQGLRVSERPTADEAKATNTTNGRNKDLNPPSTLRNQISMEKEKKGRNRINTEAGEK